MLESRDRTADPHIDAAEAFLLCSVEVKPEYGIGEMD